MRRGQDISNIEVAKALENVVKALKEEAHCLSQRFMSFKTIYPNDGEMKTFLGRGKISLLLANIVTLKNPSESFSMKYKYMKIAQIYRRN